MKLRKQGENKYMRKQRQFVLYGKQKIRMNGNDKPNLESREYWKMGRISNMGKLAKLLKSLK